MSVNNMNNQFNNNSSSNMSRRYSKIIPENELLARRSHVSLRMDTNQKKFSRKSSYYRESSEDIPKMTIDKLVEDLEF